MPALFTPNLGFDEEMRQDDDARAGLMEAAAPAVAAAQRLAHDIMPSKYASQQIEVVDTGSEVVIVNHAHGAAIDEYGSVNNPPYAPLRRGAAAAGLRIEEAPHP